MFPCRPIPWQPAEQPDPTRIVFLGDIHGNAAALRSALAMLRAKQHADHVVILGDLLTYGCHPQEVLDLTGTLIAEFQATLLLGNHDQLYLDKLTGDTAYYDSLPEWLKESIDWTCERVDLAALRALPWRESWTLGPIFAAHANPFDYGDWTYLNSRTDNARAIHSLAERGFAIGVFGHTHRRKLASAPVLTDDQQLAPERVALTDESTFLARQPGMCYAPVALNAGSVGQPRHSDRQSTVLRLEVRTDGVNVEFVPIEYDVEQHLGAIRASSLSQATRDRLGRYFGV